ncbi:hypothetical protein JKP88DRAFT_351829 [Tribonema minus]|uniref:Uncharacterized protein n=1 Tax=Tribonema minus TaxID=303371 RepID=A0A836CPA3_9STRA|nr:hypothetical protein JKP88DRAFT_351829 [Tribonema minus]
MPAALLHAAAAAATAAALRYTPPLSFLALLGAAAGSHSMAAAVLPSTAGAAAAVACAAIAALAAHFGCGVPAVPALLGAAAYALGASRHAATGALYAGPNVTLRRLSGSSCHSFVAATATLLLVPFACVWDWYSMALWLGNGDGVGAGELAALVAAGGAMFIAQKQLGRQAHTRLETGRAALASLVIAATMPDVHIGVYAWWGACAVALASALLPLRACGAVTDFSPSHTSRHRQLPQSPRSPAKTE